MRNNVNVVIICVHVVLVYSYTCCGIAVKTNIFNSIRSRALRVKHNAAFSFLSKRLTIKKKSPTPT